MARVHPAVSISKVTQLCFARTHGLQGCGIMLLNAPAPSISNYHAQAGVGVLTLGALSFKTCSAVTPVSTIAPALTASTSQVTSLLCLCPERHPKVQ